MCISNFYPQTISAMQKKGESFEKLIQDEKRQLHFLTVFISKWFQFLCSSFPNLYTALPNGNRLEWRRGSVPFLTWLLNTGKQYEEKWVKEISKLFMKTDSISKCGIFQILPFMSLTG